MSEIDAVGDIAQAGLTARAVEPAHGEGDGHTHERACLNCAASLDGPYCRMCGQRAHVHRTLKAFFHDLLHGVLHFEGKIWRTLPLLVWHPGRLTREYIDGRRASYVSPIALFLFVVFLTFAAISATGKGIDFGDTITMNGTQVPVADAEADLNRQVAALERQRSEALAAGRPVTAIDEELQGLRNVLRMTEAIKNDDIEEFAAGIDASQPDRPAATGFSLQAMWDKARANPALVIYQLQSNAYKFSWLLIPISVPFLWLLFPFSRRFHLYDHTVFVTYSLSFMMLVLTIVAEAVIYGITALVVLPLLYVPVHMYRQIRGAYGTSRLGALARTALLVVFAWMALALWAVALLGLVLGA